MSVDSGGEDPPETSLTIGRIPNIFTDGVEQAEGEKITAQQLSDSIFFNPLKTVRSKDPVKPKIKNPFVDEQLTKLDGGRLLNIKAALANVQKNISFVGTLSMENDTRTILLGDDVRVPMGSALGHQARAHADQVTIHLPELDEVPIDLPVENKDMVDILIGMPPVHNRSLQELSFAEAADIEKQTRQQSQLDLWWELRKFRFTASKFGYVCKRRLFNEEFIKQFTSRGESLSHVAAITHGRKYEVVAAEYFVSQNLNLKFFKCGLIIHPYALHLGASPDGIIFDSKIDSYGLLEIKCPYSGKANNLCEYLNLKTFCLKKDENNVLC
ncbi:unnamed protein product [Phyllotreta striolata]|uniref:YqaJ viral recombinase domain-containing protein n=1 Tax=Phyllotreta striolata TaxID=444603 RepID=A0A9N9XML6_PHYSR|nr:unnamed protein product [Phyllotreta striolata]